MRRTFLLEPNLRNFGGHPFEFSIALLDAAQALRINAILVCHQEANEEWLGCKRNIIRLISAGSFENIDNRGETFCADLRRLRELVHLSHEDVVIVLTAHLNEIAGIRRFMSEATDHRPPRFFLVVHQLYPPEPDFKAASSEKRRGFWLKRLEGELAKLGKDVTLCSTPSRALRSKLQSYFAGEVIEIPLPFPDASREHTFFARDERPDEREANAVFLGDGRFEKGLSILLDAVPLDIRGVAFTIQSSPLRGYSKRHAQKIRRLLALLAEERRIALLGSNLSRDQFQAALLRADFVILPYHPLSYDARVSGILVQSLLVGKPAIVSADTWLAEEVMKYDAGVKFAYFVRSHERCVQALRDAVVQMVHNHSRYKAGAQRAAQIYSKVHNATAFLDAVFRS